MNQTFDVDVLLKKTLTNVLDLEILNNPQWQQPNVGDHVQITSWDNQSYVQECVKLSKLSHLTVAKVHPYIVGVSGKHYWAYEIEIEEGSIRFFQWTYKILSQ